MLENPTHGDKPFMRGIYLHSITNADKVLRYSETNRFGFDEHPTVVKRCKERTIDIYASLNGMD